MGHIFNLSFSYNFFILFHFAVNTKIVRFSYQFFGQILQNRGFFSAFLFTIFDAISSKIGTSVRSNFWYQYLIEQYTTFGASCNLIF